LATVLIGIPEELQARLQNTLFWRADMRRTAAAPADIFSVARTLSPDLILLSDEQPEKVRELLEQLRREPVTHDAVVIVLSHAADPQATWDRSGASIVLPVGFGEANDQAPWHARLEELLNLRQRRETRVLADFAVRGDLTAAGQPATPVTAIALNISSRGMLLETPALLPRGARAELLFRLAGTADVAVVGEVVRTAETADGKKLAGIHFVVVRKDARLAIRDFLRAQRPAGSNAD
jgi:hypothetical protein